VLAHAERYGRQTVTNTQEKLRGFTDERNAPFVEFVKATHLTNDTPSSGPWFTDLLKLGLLGDGPVSGTDEEVSRKQAWLKQWGYVDPKRGRTKPFETSASGLLCWSHDEGDARFMAHAQARADGILIPLEPLYAAATFGLLALDMFTTTGLQVTWNMALFPLLSH